MHESLPQLPDELHTMLAGCHVQRDRVGQSSARVYHLQRQQDRFYLKYQSPHPQASMELRKEKELLSWLQSRFPVPVVHFYDETDAGGYLLLSALPGCSLDQAAENWSCETVTRLYAETLRELHALPTANCPYRISVEQRFAEARYALEHDLVDIDDLEEAYRHMAPEQLYQRLLELRPDSFEPVLSHGDYCPENIIVDKGRLSGLIDWGRGGIDDRYQDLALALRSLDHRYGRSVWPLFLDGYGLADLNEQKLNFYILLDEFF